MTKNKRSSRECGLALYALLTLLLQCAVPATLFSQQSNNADTLSLTRKEAEKVFLEHNLPLLAQRLNINQADARILQARAWPNPTFQLNDVQVYNTPSTDPSPGLLGTSFWKNRTFGAQLEQMIQLAGKRKKNIAFETRNKELAESSFSDFLLSLKAEFRQDLSELLYLQQVTGNLAYQQNIVADLLKAQDAQYKAGNISQSQLYRLKALQISLQSDFNALSEKNSSLQQSLKSLMALQPKTYLLLREEEDPMAWETLRKRSVDDLLGLARQNNAALKSAENEKKVNEAGLAVEKANAVPDLNLNLSYDRNGNNQLDFVGAGFSINLPFFNRNKGNIKAAAFEVEKSNLLQKNKITEVNNAVVKTWTDLNKAIILYESIDKDYLEKLDDMIKALSRNFTQRNISMLEFLDFFESFKESKEKYYDAVRNISVKKEDLNYLTASEL